MAERDLQPSELANLAMSDPGSALAVAERLLPTVVGADRIHVLRAVGVACNRTGDFAKAEGHLRLAIAKADELGDDELWSLATMTFSATHLFQGQAKEAISMLEAAAARSSGAVQAEVWFQLGTTHAQLGAFPAALECYEFSLPALEQHELHAAAAQLLGNRALIHHWQGSYRLALRDFDLAGPLFDASDDSASSLYNKTNKAMTLFRLGRLPDALALFDEAEPGFAALGLDTATTASDRCEMLMAAGLFEEALQCAHEGSRFHADNGNVVRQLESLVFAGEAALALGRTSVAEDTARIAASLPDDNLFLAMKARAALVGIQAQQARGDSTMSDVAAMVDLGDVMRRHGRPASAIEATLSAAEAAMAHGEITVARELVDRVAAQVRRSPLHVQAFRWRLLTELRHRVGDRRGALSSLRAGLRSLDRLLAGAGSYELRVKGAQHASALISVGAELLSDRPRQLARTVERLRSGPVQFVDQTTTSPELAMALELLRAVESETHAGTAAAAKLLAAQQKVAALARHGTGSTSESRAGSELSDDESLLTFVVTSGHLVRIHETADQAYVDDCGDLASLVELIADQAFATRQLARRSQLQGDAVDSLRANHRDSSQALQTRLLPDNLSDRVIINPDPRLRTICWAALPSLWDRLHCVAPSLEIARRRVPTKYDNVAVFGSSALPHVPEELDQIAGHHGTTSMLDPAYVEVASAGADLWHVAGHMVAHGTNPLFSAVPFDGWSLHGHQMLGSIGAPQVAVLSACNTGINDAVADVELGFATALLAGGASSIVATQSLVEDGETITATMLLLHEHLRRGVSPAAALAAVRREAADEDRAIVGCLVVLGAGW